MTVVTSGIYERYFMKDGVRYHHILDTRTGFPIQNGLTSVSIITESSIDADGLSTSVFALGLEKGRKLVESLPGVKAVFIDTEKKVYLSAGTEKIFTITNKTFSLAK
jgi:thiamine biosynthesis lipoprotein